MKTTISKFKRLKIKRLADVDMPSYAHEGDAGIDLRAAEAVTIEPMESEKVRTGIAAEIPDGCVGLVFPRSGLGSNGLTMRNAVGVVDSGYRGEIMAAMWNTTEQPWSIGKGDRIAQLVVVPYVRCEIEEADGLSDTERGEGGYGSTGTK